MSPGARASAWRWTERTLVTLGLACLGWCAVVWWQAAAYQRAQRTTLDRLIEETAGPGAEPAPPPESRSLIGSLEIDRLRFSAVVIEGDDRRALALAIGHLPDTPMPWDAGNSALAAHRDTFFRPLKDVAVGDVLRVTTARGTLRYEVRETLIVNPEDTWVLDPSTRPTLTLITCYPFSYVGHAPQRFVVRAERIDAGRAAALE